uniref:Uncharacterized protein n=1 Tax=Romanomermis culicivorax TaxID=13658 RepID=A0A915K3T6_ROMCU
MHNILVTLPARLKVEETLKFVENRKSEKPPESTRKMEENCTHRSTALGYEKGFYKKLANPDNAEIENFDCENVNLQLLYEADKHNFDLPQTSAPQKKHKKLHDLYLRKSKI